MPTPSSSGDPCSLAGDGTVTVNVWAVPGAGRSSVEGVRDGHLRVRVAAPAHDGRANQALCAFLAEQLNVPRGAVTVVRGERSRRKLVRVSSPLTRAAIESLCASG